MQSTNRHTFVACAVTLTSPPTPRRHLLNDVIRTDPIVPLDPSLVFLRLVRFRLRDRVDDEGVAALSALRRAPSL
eukprot:30294-Pelagococcus_subviridis.AAC.15